MKLHAMIVTDTVKPAGEFTNGKGELIKYDEKRILTVLELPQPGQEGVKHLMEMRIPVADPVAGKDSSIAGLVGDFVITEVRTAQKQDQEVGIIGRVVGLTGQVGEKPLATK